MCDGKPGHVHEFAYKCPECLQREARIAVLVEELSNVKEASLRREMELRRQDKRIAELESERKDMYQIGKRT